jgi:hypothetical protein
VPVQRLAEGCLIGHILRVCVLDDHCRSLCAADPASSNRPARPELVRGCAPSPGPASPSCGQDAAGACVTASR